MKRICISLLLVLALMMAVCQAKSLPDELSKIAGQIDDGRNDEAESALLLLRERNPKDPGVPTLLARIEYLRSVSGLPEYPGMPPTNWDPARMDAAERWIREAIELGPEHANAWVVYGQIKYARYRLAESLEMLEKAESLDPSSIKLRLRKGATLRALSTYRGDKSLLDASAVEYQRAIVGNIDDGNERLAASELGEIFSTKGEFDKALGYLSDALVTAEGSEKAFILEKRAKAQLYAGHWTCLILALGARHWRWHC
jgi:tetratricopeptide (TPR) repeat protein